MDYKDTQANFVIGSEGKAVQLTPVLNSDVTFIAGVGAVNVTSNLDYNPKNSKWVKGLDAEEMDFDLQNQGEIRGLRGKIIKDSLCPKDGSLNDNLCISPEEKDLT